MFGLIWSCLVLFGLGCSSLCRIAAVSSKVGIGSKCDGLLGIGDMDIAE